MNGSHAAMLDDVAVYALGTLPEAEAQRVRAHLATCSECRGEYEALLPAAAAVGQSAEACTDAQNGEVYASPLLKARIMREVRASAVATTPAKAAGTRFPFAYLFAAACLVVALGVGAINLSLMNQLHAARTAQTQPPAHSTHDVALDEQTLADLVNDKAKRYVVPGGEIVKSGGRLYITMHDMAPPPKGKVYQAWTLPKGSKKMVPGATFVPDKRGVAILPLHVDANVTHAVAVSVEPAGGSKQPTSSPVVLELLD